MPKNTPTRAIDVITPKYSGISGIGAASALAVGGVTDHSQLTGLTKDDHLQYLTADRGALYFVPLARTVSPGSGLSGGGALSADISLAVDATVARNTWPVSAGLGLTGGGNLAAAGVTLNVGVSGLGLSVGADAVVLTSSSNPGAAAAILASDSSGALTLQQLAIGSAMTLYSTDVPANGPDILFTASGMLAAQASMWFYIDSDNNSTNASFAWRVNSMVTGSGTELMRLTEDGYLGIGNTPSYTLDVTGDGRFTNSVLTPTLTTTTGDLTLSPADDLVLTPTDAVQLTDGKPFNGSTTFASGFAGSGFELKATGGKTWFELDNLTVRGTMSVYELLIHQIRATNGSIFVSSTAKIATVSGTDPTYTLTTDGETAHGFLINDVIRAQRFTGSGTYQCNLTVTAVADLYTFTVTRVSGVAPRAGMEFVRLGNTTNTARQGSIYLTADDSGAPFIDIVNGISAHSQWNTTGKIKGRFGKLDGLSLPSPNTDEYGIWAGTGVTDASQYIRVSNQGVLLNNVPFKMFNSGTEAIHIAAWNDVWLGPSSADKRLTWDGSTLAISGQVTATSGKIASWDIGVVNADTISAASGNIKIIAGAGGTARFEVGSSGAAYAGMVSGANAANAVFWAGSTHANRNATDATAPAFKVTLGGALTATSATITGSVTAGGGAVWMNSAGLGLDATTGKFTAATASWWYSTNRILSIGTTSDLGAPTGGFIEMLTGYPLTITAPTGITIASNTTFSGTVSVGANAVWHAGNFTPANYAPLASPAFSGTPKVGSSAIWHAGNDGSGSGLDADLLDNHDTSYFATATHNHDSTYAALSGASFTGDINTSGAIGGSWTQIGTYAARYKKFGDMVILQGTVSASGTGSFTAGTLAAGYRPPNTIYLSVLNANKNVQKITINTTGTIVFDAHEASIAVSLDNIQFSVTAF